VKTPLDGTTTAFNFMTVSTFNNKIPSVWQKAYADFHYANKFREKLSDEEEVRSIEEEGAGAQWIKNNKTFASEDIEDADAFLKFKMMVLRGLGGEFEIDTINRINYSVRVYNSLGVGRKGTMRKFFRFLTKLFAGTPYASKYENLICLEFCFEYFMDGKRVQVPVLGAYANLEVYDSRTNKMVCRYDGYYCGMHTTISQILQVCSMYEVVRITTTEVLIVERERSYFDVGILFRILSLCLYVVNDLEIKGPGFDE